MQGDAGALAQAEDAGVEGELARKRAQQRRLAAAVSAREGHAIAVLELERDVAKEGPAPDVLSETGGGGGGQEAYTDAACSAASSLT